MTSLNASNMKYFRKKSTVKIVITRGILTSTITRYNTIPNPTIEPNTCYWSGSRKVNRGYGHLASE